MVKDERCLSKLNCVTCKKKNLKKLNCVTVNHASIGCKKKNP